MLTYFTWVRIHQAFLRISVGYFRLFIGATGCPSERRLRVRLLVTGDSVGIQDEITENSTWFFNAGDSKPQPAVTPNIVFTSPTLYSGGQLLLSSPIHDFLEFF